MDSTAIQLVRHYILDHFNQTERTPQFHVFTVWKCKALQNWKFLLSSTLPHGMYYEVTYNGDRKEWYLDAYKKFDNRVIRTEPSLPSTKPEEKEVKETEEKKEEGKDDE